LVDGGLEVFERHGGVEEVAKFLKVARVGMGMALGGL
jgi:hypothetical protein